MMKWRVRRHSSIEAEEVKSSLDLLDSVLAEYDDEDEELASCFAEWPYVPAETIRCTDILLCSTPNGNDDDAVVSERVSSIGCQLRRPPPPVVPKRNPETRLSSYAASFPSSPPKETQNATRPSSLPVKVLSTFGGCSSSFPPPCSPPNAVPVTLSRSKTLPSDFRQSLHFDVYLSSEMPAKKPEQKRHSKKRWSKKLW